MILKSIHTHCGEEKEYISIDLSDHQNPNLILDIYECVNVCTNEYEFTIQIPRTSKKYPSKMVISEKDFLDFAEAVNKIAHKIVDRQTETEAGQEPF